MTRKTRKVAGELLLHLSVENIILVAQPTDTDTHAPFPYPPCLSNPTCQQDVRDGLKKWETNKDLKALKNEITMAIEKIPTDVNVDDDSEMKGERSGASLQQSDPLRPALTLALNPGMSSPCTLLPIVINSVVNVRGRTYRTNSRVN